MLKHHASVSLAELQRGDVGPSRVYMRQAYRHLLPEELYAPRIRMPQPARWHVRPRRFAGLITVDRTGRRAMDLNQVSYFINLAETVNFTAAARLRDRKSLRTGKDVAVTVDYCDRWTYKQTK